MRDCGLRYLPVLSSATGARYGKERPAGALEKADAPDTSLVRCARVSWYRPNKDSYDPKKEQGEISREQNREEGEERAREAGGRGLRIRNCQTLQLIVTMVPLVSGNCFLPLVREVKVNGIGSLVSRRPLAQLGKCGSMCLQCRRLGSLSKAPIWKYAIAKMVLQDSCGFKDRWPAKQDSLCKQVVMHCP